MPRRDHIHDAVKNALIKDGWTIVNDPYRIVYEDTDVYADLRIEKIDEAATLRRTLVIEIKGFTGDSPIHNLAAALGQYELYRIYLKMIAPEEKLYLAISATVYDEQFLRPAFAVVIVEKSVPLVIIDTESEEVVRWIN